MERLKLLAQGLQVCEWPIQDSSSGSLPPNSLPSGLSPPPSISVPCAQPKRTPWTTLQLLTGLPQMPLAISQNLDDHT